MMCIFIRRNAGSPELRRGLPPADLCSGAYSQNKINQREKIPFYDDSGIRTSKTVNGTKTQYYLNGSTILTQITGDNRFDFFYDENGLLLGFSYNGAKYYYIRNLQNDIIGNLDSTSINRKDLSNEENMDSITLHFYGHYTNGL